MQWEQLEEEAAVAAGAAGVGLGPEHRRPPDRRAFARALIYDDPPADAHVDEWDEDDDRDDPRDDIDDFDDEDDDVLADKSRWSSVKQALQGTWVYTLVQFVVVLVMQLLTRACVNSFLHSR